MKKPEVLGLNVVIIYEHTSFLHGYVSLHYMYITMSRSDSIKTDEHMFISVEQFN